MTVTDPSAVRGDQGSNAETDALLWAAGEPLHWRWVGLGFAVIAPLHAILVFLVFPSLPASASGLKIALGLLPYVVGGAVTAAVSKRRSLLDAFYASVIPASLLTFMTELFTASATLPDDMGEMMGRVRWIAVLAPLLGSVLLAMAGAWLGERIIRGVPNQDPGDAAGSERGDRD